MSAEEHPLWKSAEIILSFQFQQLLNLANPRKHHCLRT